MHLISYISDTLRIPVHSVMDVVREHQSPDIVPQTQAATPVIDDTPMRSSQHSTPGSRHSIDDSSIRVGDVHITAEGLDDFGSSCEACLRLILVRAWVFHHTWTCCSDLAALILHHYLAKYIVHFTQIY